MGPPLGLLPAELLSRHILGRLSAGEARCLCKATRVAFDAGCTKLVIGAAAVEDDLERLVLGSDNSLERLVLGMPALEELQFTETVSFSAKAQLLLAAVARNRGQLHKLDVQFEDDSVNEAEAKALAPPLSQLASLQALDLCGCRLRVAALEALAPAVQTLTQLKMLDLSSDFKAAELAVLAPAVQSVSGLQRLSLRWSSLAVEGAAPHILTLFDLPLLQSLDVGNMQLEAGGARALGPALLQLTALTRLDLDCNNLRAEGAAALAPSIARLTTLQCLNLRVNGLGMEAMAALAPSLANLKALRELDLGWNKMGPGGAAALAPVLVALPQLQSLNVRSNDLGPEGVSTLGPAMKALRHLGLGGNDLGLVEALALAPHLAKCTRLTSLDISCDNLALETSGVTALVAALQSLPRLKHLELRRNYLVPDVEHPLDAPAVSIFRATIARVLPGVEVTNDKDITII